MVRAMSKSEPGERTDVGATSAEPEADTSAGDRAPAELAPVRGVVTAKEPAAQKRDVALPLGPAEGGGVAVLRLKDETLEVGLLREARDGQPVMGELVRLEARGDGSPLYDVEVLHDARPGASARATAEPPSKSAAGGPVTSRARKGPPLVASEAYREGWEQVFGARSPRGDGQLN